MKRDQLSQQAAQHQIQKVEKERREHCRLVTGKEWGLSKYYDLSINTSVCGIPATKDIIQTFLASRSK